jgi:DNA polymerase
MTDPTYIKLAYNAAFEWHCLSKYFKILLPVEQWQCVQMHGLYCGYTIGLAATGEALGLPDDKRKLTAGKALIKYFSVPCTPTKSGGGRTRNLPKHDPAKWNLFKDYCKQDVVTEIEIEKRLSDLPVPDTVQREWEIDRRVNSRGVAADMILVRSAMIIIEEVTRAMKEDLFEVTGLDNVGSVKQMKEWIQKEIKEDLPNLDKDTVAEILNRADISDRARCAIELYRDLGKTSLSKYEAITETVCADGRIRGLFQFYGANRSGRWSGRLVQVQNLPRTYIEPLPLARELVKNREIQSLRFVYGTVTDALSQLIRAAFVAKKGNVLIDADFSAIEARVISWLAGEQWRLDVFKTHGKIYEASASQMFGVPLDKIKKGNPEYALRQKGKVAELALGYQGGTNALVAMGALNMGLSEAELPEIVSRWREANRRIRDLWYAVENAALTVVTDGGCAAVNGLIFALEHGRRGLDDYLTVLLPSGRKLCYVSPRIVINRFDKRAVSYMEVKQTTKKWAREETYGGKLVENIVQAIARDCLAFALLNLEIMGYEVVMHCHDEVVIERTESSADLKTVCDIMSRPAPWAQGLPLNADGWVSPYYKKD